MKKLTALLSAFALGLTAAPMASFAETSSAEIMMGDVNCDGKLDATDATLILGYYTAKMSDVMVDNTSLDSIILYYSNIVKYGDINGDGVIDAGDATYVLHKYTEYLSTDMTGDVNRDGIVDLYDAVDVFIFYEEKTSYTEEQKLSGEADTLFWSTGYERKKLIEEYGDVNGNGAVTKRDAVEIMNRYMDRTGKTRDEINAELYDIYCELKEKYAID